MKLRQLEARDADKMLAWMHDNFVVEKLQNNFADKTIEDCRNFIANSNDDSNLHLAITNDSDEYMGTVSLKNITVDRAEFAITICREAMGSGYSIWAMREILKTGFEKYHLKDIYWCVAPDNLRALRFYDKYNYPRVKAEEIGNGVQGYSEEQIERYIWYKVSI